MNLKRGPVEFKHAITYVNKVKVSPTATFSSMNYSFEKRQPYVLHRLD